MKKIINPNRIKILCAVILLFSIALPFSSCTREYDEDGKIAFATNKPAVETVTEYKYPVDLFKYDTLAGWLFLYSFLWPVPILILRRFLKSKTAQKVLWIGEPVFFLGALYFLFMASFLENPAIGKYLAVFSTCGYGLTWLYELIVKILNFFKKKQAPA